MQPHWDYPLEPPAGVAPADVGIGQWQPGLSFGETSELTMDACGWRQGGGTCVETSSRQARQQGLGPGEGTRQHCQKLFVLPRLLPLSNNPCQRGPAVATLASTLQITAKQPAPACGLKRRRLGQAK